MAPYFRLITSQSIFEARSLSENPRPFSELPSLASSKWSRERLFAARVIRCEGQNNLLPMYSHDFITPEGQAWAALAEFKGPLSRRGLVSSANGDTEAEPSEGFINSSLIQVGSSSPADNHSHGTPDSSVGYVDGGHDGSIPLEEDTVRLVSCVFRHILYFIQSFDSRRLVVEFRDARMRHAAPFLNHNVVAIDDGGLCLRRQIGGSFVLSRNQVVALEAKRRFQIIEDGRPVISDECFAQMVCEAIAARLVDPLEELRHESVIIVNATQYY
ncbi:hypothetical protein CEP53_011845, partial [Fusarium sp. AF-6]